MKYVNTGAYSDAIYSDAPDSHTVRDGSYFLSCNYRLSKSDVS